MTPANYSPSTKIITTGVVGASALLTGAAILGKGGPIVKRLALASVAVNVVQVVVAIADA